MALTFITGNQNKLKYVSQWIGMPLTHRKLDLDELQEVDLLKVVEHKARQAYDLVRSPVLVEDCELCCPALGGLPGPFIKWFESVGGEIVCKMLDGFDDRSAVAHLAYGIYDGKNFYTVEGEMRGQIAKAPRGKNGFGFDPIFINEGYDLTRSELDDATYAATSYRKKGVDNLKIFLLEHPELVA